MRKIVFRTMKRTMLFAGLLLSSLSCIAQLWNELDPIPVHVDDAVGFSIGEAGFVGSGRDDALQYQTAFYKFQDGSWITIDPMTGIGRQYATSFSFQTKGCVLTGVGPNDSLIKEMQCYNALNEQWEIKPDFPGEPRLQASSFTIGNLGFCGGGRSLTETFDDWYMYDESKDQWTRIRDFPIPLYECVAFQTLGFGFVGLGKDLSGNFNDRVFKYLPLTDEWVEIASFPGTARIYSIGFELNNAGFICTGLDENDEFINEFWQYDPKADVWKKLTDPDYSLRRGVSGFTVDHCIHMISGLDSSFNRLDEHWSYCTNPENTGIEILLYPNPANEQIMIIPSENAEVYVYSVVGDLADQFSVEEEYLWDCSSLANGVYLLLFQSEKTTVLKKVIISNRL